MSELVAPFSKQHLFLTLSQFNAKKEAVLARAEMNCFTCFVRLSARENMFRLLNNNRILFLYQTDSRMQQLNPERKG